MRDAVHNETLGLLEHLPPLRRAVFLCWAVLIGTSVAPGAAQWLRLVAKRDPHATAKLAASLHGRLAGWRTTRQVPVAVAPSPEMGSI